MKLRKEKSYIERFIKVKNINPSNKKFKRRYLIGNIKYTIKNKNKINFFKKQKDLKKEAFLKELYEKRKEELLKLKKYRENKSYILTCYIVTYNQQNTIRECIESILEQETDYPFLIKILDDGSLDDTFDICLEYANKYPEKIELKTVMHNSGGKMLTVAYEDIQTKYFCRIDGDDYWCDKNKIQDSLDFLEKNDDYATYAHDTAVYYQNNDITLSNIHDCEPNENYNEEISLDNFFYVHVSSRIHRNVLDFKNKYKNIRKRDRILWYLLLNAGKVYYDDKIKAVYRISKHGFYAGVPLYIQQMQRWLMCYKMNKFFNYKYDKTFTSDVSNKKLKLFKKFFGTKIGWDVFIFYLKYLNIIKEVSKKIFLLLKKEYSFLYNAEKYTSDFYQEEMSIIDRVRFEVI